ncbi:aspartyl protease family protein [Belliella kenyensis]|uniref:Aspartyl protease family protein n=2 Tax=Belliella kenyensis TaxID=1472724 RepID=A0ABV8EMZ7_9BACT|nr:aspartyl protease family protein [Belliella kenyensis]MCH7401671.1 aspartyl protease family protein [Belliella kenyensis]MDN3603051.1 aspartyl protease family protein [Belliella kenyensis]
MISIPAYAQLPGFFMKEDKKKVNIKFFNNNNLIIIPISINGSEPLNFIFDTGIKSNILFSKSLGDELDLQYSRKLNLVGADGKTVLTASVSLSNRLDMEKIMGEYQTLLVLEEDFFELEKLTGIPIYGVIGYEFFKNNPIKVNYDVGQITFYKSDRLKWRPFGFRKTALKLENSKPYIHADITQILGGKLNAKLLIDTGANHGLLLNPETTNAIKFPPITLESELGRSLGGDLYGLVGRSKELDINGLKFSNLITSFPEENDFSYVIKESGRQGSLGSEILSRLEIIFDYQRERILYRKSSSFSNPFEFDMSGITPKQYSYESGRIYIAKLKEASPASQAGLQEMDEIIKINNIPIEFWKLPDITKYLKSEVGKEVKLTILRFDAHESDIPKELNFTFKLKRMI